MPVRPIPEGFRTVTPYLLVNGVAPLIDFLKAALGAVEVHRMAAPDGAVMHAEIRIGDSMVMLGDPKGRHAPMPACIHLYVPDADALYRQAIAAGGKSLIEPKDQFYGDRMAGITDPAGNQWWMATHIEDLSPEDMKRRETEFMQKKQ
jgi:PhnB protein